MKKQFALCSLLSLLCLFIATDSARAVSFQLGKKYRIESNFDKNKYNRSGAFGLGAANGVTTNTYYVTGGNYSTDCWWYIEDVDGNGTFAIKNASTGKYLTMKKKYEDCTLEDNISKNAKWRIKFDCGALLVYINDSEPQYLLYNQSAKNESPGNRNFITDRSEGTTPFKLFNFYDENGVQVNPADVPDLDYGKVSPTIPAQSSDIKSYATDVKINNQAIAYASNRRFWLATMPTGALTITFKEIASNVSISLQDNGTEVKNASALQTCKPYQLVVTANGKNVTSTIYFTTLPVMDIRYEGKMGVGMNDYLWGNFTLSSADTKESVSLTARFRSRGATASKYEKHSMNMKIRELGTDAEVDTTLLGIRSASSWILDAAAVDYTKMRNRLCFDLWNEFSKLPHDSKFNRRNGTAGRFVEVIENGEYRGIYSINDRINRKLLGLKKPKEETATVRGVSYKANELMKFEPSERTTFLGNYGDTRHNGNLYCGWELKEPEDYPGIAAWAPIDELYDNNNAQNKAYVKSHFHIDNMVDYHLFVLTFLIIDNENKNEFLSIYDITSQKEDERRFFFTPWDLDTALGGDANAVNKDGSYTKVSVQKIKDQNINQCYPFRSMLNGGFVADAEYLNKFIARWKNARENEFSLYNVTKKMREYGQLFVSSGAYEREKTAKGTMKVDDLAKELEYIGKWYADQINAMDDWLGLPHTNQMSGINDIVVSPLEYDVYYDLFGRKVENPSNGIFIKNGKKFIIK